MSYVPQFPTEPQPGTAYNPSGAPPPGQAPPTGAPPQEPAVPYPPGYGPGPTLPEPQVAPQSSYGAYPPPPLQQYYPPNPQLVLPTLQYMGLVVPNPHAPPLPYGVAKVPGYDPAPDAESVRKATKGFGTNDELLIKTLTKIGILQMDALADYYVTKYGKRLVDLLDSETSSYFGMGIHALATGPLAWDIELLHKALDGVGTNEDLLTEILLGRTNEDVYRLTVGYKSKYGVDLAVKIKGDLSGKTEKLYLIALNANRPPDTAPVDQVAVNKDIDVLFEASQKRNDKDEMAFFDIILTRSNPHLSAVIDGYGKKYRSLTKVVKATFSGHTRDSLLYVVEGVKPKRDGKGIWRDAKLIDKAMVGFGTRDNELVWRIVRAHWDPRRMAAIKEAYHRRTRKILEDRVGKETSGSYKKLMLALIEGHVKG
ncbi:putative annexin repeats [Lyophyllum shimeji]|uniref:Annexin repeats n=1 Tax=Lyophyllum shimeji TaxID=47721 RepID=A0A9P3Q0D9_LYOSH|nr:putative annexin repeats [Lyophyllum shimeji]